MVEFKFADGNKLLVNIDQIVSIEKWSNKNVDDQVYSRCLITLTSGVTRLIIGTYDSIRDQINDARNAAT